MAKAGSVLVVCCLQAFAEAQEAAKPDSPDVRGLLESAKKRAGTEWTAESTRTSGSSR